MLYLIVFLMFMLTVYLFMFSAKKSEEVTNRLLAFFFAVCIFILTVLMFNHAVNEGKSPTTYNRSYYY